MLIFFTRLERVPPFGFSKLSLHPTSMFATAQVHAIFSFVFLLDMAAILIILCMDYLLKEMMYGNPNVTKISNAKFQVQMKLSTFSSTQFQKYKGCHNSVSEVQRSCQLKVSNVQRSCQLSFKSTKVMSFKRSRVVPIQFQKYKGHEFQKVKGRANSVSKVQRSCQLKVSKVQRS